MNKQYRLKQGTEISQIVQRRIRVSTRLYTLYYSFNHQDLKIAVVCGKKCGNAVNRNYEKRVMREIIHNRLNVLQGYHIVLVVRPEAVGCCYKDKEKDINYLINKLLKGTSKDEKN